MLLFPVDFFIWHPTILSAPYYHDRPNTCNRFANIGRIIDIFISRVWHTESSFVTYYPTTSVTFRSCRYKLWISSATMIRPCFMTDHPIGNPFLYNDTFLYSLRPFSFWPCHRYSRQWFTIAIFSIIRIVVNRRCSFFI